MEWLCVHYDQMRIWDHKPDPWGYGKGLRLSPKPFKNPWKELFLIYIKEEKYKFPNEEECSWEEVKS